MSQYREHDPVLIEEFNGLWMNGDVDSVPIDHFSDCEDIVLVQNGFRTRPGVAPYAAIHNVVRMYNYVMQNGQSVLALNDIGEIYHRISDSLLYGPILSIPVMTDFHMISIAGRAYITPFYTETRPDQSKYQRGLQDEFVYVYKGDGTLARKAAGDAPSGTLSPTSSATVGDVEAGVHVFGVAYETDTGFITKIAGFAYVNATGGKKVDISAIPVSPDAFVIARRLVATVAIDPTLYTGDLNGYEFFFIPDGRIANNTATTATVNFFDAALVASADYLSDLLEEIPAGVNLATYHGRMVVSASYDDISLQRVSTPGEPEAIDAVSGLIIIPLDGNPVTCAQEFRDVLYTFKQTRTFGISDNGSDPSSWPVVVIDQGIGASVHGIASVLDSGGVNIEYLMLIDFSGVMIFNGVYARPELSWKIRDLWFSYNRNRFNYIQVMNDSLSQNLYMTMPDGILLVANYSNGLDYQNVRWTKWRFAVDMLSIALIDGNNLLLSTNQIPGFPPP